MFAVILFQINILALALFSAFQCAVRKKNEYDGDGDVSLIQATPQHYAEVATAKPRPQNDDFSVGIPPPHIPLADKSDERTLA
uniref:Uncharacterized protein n=1 Tax=Caenorhabditis tropicalis TaxID=1561998 RepID=A0A1I7V0S2_9PELO